MSGVRHHDSASPAGPYCAVCNYPLEGLTESSKCPECGNPLVEVLRWPDLPGPVIGKRWRSKATVWGKPLIHIASGPGPDGIRGKARGFIAIGDDAMGFVAIGGMARGVIALGGGAIGVFAFGGGAAGIVSALGGGAAAGGLACGGGALAGGVAAGGGAFGILGSVSGMGLRSPLGLPMPETLWNTIAVVAVLLLLTAGYAGYIVLSRQNSESG